MYGDGVFSDFANHLGVDASDMCCACNMSPTAYHEECPGLAEIVIKEDVVWRDVNGYSCGHYEAKLWCADGTYGDNWIEDHGEEATFDVLANADGIDASTVCCSCISSSSPIFKNKLKCNPNKVATKSVWRDAGGHTCADYVERNWCKKGSYGEVINQIYCRLFYILCGVESAYFSFCDFYTVNETGLDG